MRIKLVMLWLVGAAAVGCGRDAPETCQMRSPTITHGVFGCITSTDDIGEAQTEVFPDFEVQMFEEMPPPTPEDGLIPDYSARSDALGFYELELPAGDFWICTTFRRCAELEIPETGPVRKDYDFGPGPGW